MPKRTNEQWLSDLRSEGPAKDAALVDLRATILAGLPYALEKWLSPDDPRFTPFAEEVSQEAVLRVLSRLDSFQGRSQFTTWVYTIVVRVALSELRRARWQEVSLEELLEGKEANDEPAEFAAPQVGTEPAVEKRQMLALIEQAVRQELTEKQRMALMAVAAGGMPSEEVARRMGMQRNALYKLLHDARLKLKKALEKEGLTPDEILAAFEGK